jgi:hypothetical protein
MPPVFLQNFTKMYEATVALHKCITIKCKKEEQSEQSEQSNKGWRTTMNDIKKIEK